jgi:putative transposase
MIVAMIEAKKVKGRKRHIVVDTLGNLLEIVVHAANMHDTKAAHFVLSKVAKKYPTIEGFSGDAGYRKTALEFVEKGLKLKMHISTKIKDAFAILPIRWIVERHLHGLVTIEDYQKIMRDMPQLLRIW